MSASEPSDVDLVTKLVRRQGEELLRVRKELEHSQRISTASIEALHATERRVEALQKDSSQRRLRLTNMTQELAVLQTESNSLATELDAARAELRIALSLSGSLFLTHDAQDEFSVVLNNTSDPVANQEDTGGDNSGSGESGPPLVSGPSLSSVSVNSSLEQGLAESNQFEGQLQPPSATSTDSRSNDTNSVASDSLTPTSVRLPTTEPHPTAEDEPVSRSERNGLQDISAEIMAPSTAEQVPLEPKSSEKTTMSHPVTETQLSAGESGGTVSSGSTSTAPPSSSAGQVAFSEKMCLSIVLLEPVCSRVPSKEKAFKELWSKGLTNLANNCRILKPAEALVALPNSRNHTFITISERATNLCSDLTQFDRWKGQLLLHNTSAKHLYYLGEYKCAGAGKINSKEYDSLPEETKQYIFLSAKTVRPGDIKTKEQLVLSMGAANGIFIAKTDLHFVAYNSDIENRFREEARKKGYT